MSELEPTKRYWFPSKKYGWGWGWPTTWEGHAVFAGFVVLTIVGFLLFSPAANPIGFALYTFALSAILVLICYVKGEPPCWRWGK